jgi:regulator of sigma E protease
MVVLLGGLIFFHELGHYLVAKFFNVRVEVFSLGFGKKIFSRTVGETEYCISLVPLGGYVKLMGDDPFKGVPPEDADRAFSTQKLYKRFFVVAAGPIFNLVLAYALFAVVFWFGQPAESTRLGSVVVNSSAWSSGLRAGDHILSIDGKQLITWKEMEEALKFQTGKTVDLEIERGPEKLHFNYTVEKTRSRNPYGEEEDAGGIKGASQYPVQSVVGISNPKSPAFIAGLRTGDLITKIETRSVDSWEEMKDTLTSFWAQKKPVTITVKSSFLLLTPCLRKFASH